MKWIIDWRRLPGADRAWDGLIDPFVCVLARSAGEEETCRGRHLPTQSVRQQGALETVFFGFREQSLESFRRSSERFA